jgi:hypothetical protein
MFNSQRTNLTRLGTDRLTFLIKPTNPQQMHGLRARFQEGRNFSMQINPLALTGQGCEMGLDGMRFAVVIHR